MPSILILLTSETEDQPAIPTLPKTLVALKMVVHLPIWRFGLRA